MTCDKNGLVYAVDATSLDLYRYDPHTNILDILGALPTYPDGDMLFYQDTLLIAAGGFWVFIVQTVTAKQPFFHRDLAKDRNFVACTLFGMFVGALLFSTSALLPSFMQTLLGYSALQSGYASMPRGVGSFCAFLLVPTLISSVGARPVLAMGIVLCVLALWQMAHFDLLMTAAPIMISGVVQGFGTGLLFAPLNVLAYVSLNPIHRTEGTIVSTMVRSLGSSLGISLIQATLTHNSAMAHSRSGWAMCLEVMLCHARRAIFFPFHFYTYAYVGDNIMAARYAT